MKNYLIMLTSILLGCAISTPVWSDDTGNSNITASPTTSMPQSIQIKGNPCKHIANACREAGKGNNRHQLWRNCVRPIISGQNIKGVTVNPLDVQACQTKIQDKIQKLQSLQNKTQS